MQTEHIDRELIAGLAETESDSRLVSIYLQTTAQPGSLQKNTIRLKNTLADARKQLESAGADDEQIRARLESVREDISNEDFLSRPGGGAAILIDRDTARVIPLANKPDERVVVASTYHLKPLFESSVYELPYYVLAISRNDVSLFRGDGRGLEQLQLDTGVPRSMDDALGRELTEKQLQHHAGDAGSNEAIFHGHGSGKDDTDAEVERFLKLTDEALCRKHLDGAPMILAGVDELTAEYRRISGYDSIFDETISGNVESLGESELHERAWPIFHGDFRRRSEQAMATLASGGGDRPGSDDLEEIVVAAADGRVAQLFVASDRECWGTFDSGKRRVVTHSEKQEGDTDLLDLAAKSALLTGADVIALPASCFPEKSLAVAMLRYETAA